MDEETKEKSSKIDISIDTEAPKKEKINMKREILQWIESLAVSVVVVAIIFTFIGRPTGVKGTSMEPNFFENDRIIITKLYTELKYGDVVTINRLNDTPLIKRIIGVGGDKIDIDFDEGIVYLNDKALDEPYTASPTNENLGVEFPVTVPPGHYFVMGDNRNVSDDSRDIKIGMIPEDNIFGKVVFRIYPFKSIGPINLDKTMKEANARIEAEKLEQPPQWE